MPRFESSISAGAKLHETITDHAQMYVYGSESIENIHSSMEGYADEYKGDPNPTQDKVFDTIQRMRIARQAVLAALGKVVSDEIIRRALTYTDGETLDIARMTKDVKPTYCDGMINFLEETIDEAFDSMSDPRHIYHDLFRHAYNYQERYISLATNKGNERISKRIGARTTAPDIYNALLDMFTDNYSNDIASFLITHGIVIQDQYEGNLPDADTIVQATEEVRPHWLALSGLSRIHIGNIYYGKERYEKILQAASQAGRFPTWSTLWPAGIKRAISSNKAAFATCPMESPLIHRAPNDPIIERITNPQRCAGQIALYGSLEANENAIQLSRFVGGNLTETGRYSTAALFVDLGRTASKLSFSDPVFRKSLTEARRVRDELAAKRVES